MPTAQVLLNKFVNVKTLPHVALRLSELISNHESTMQEFEKLIKMDPTLVVRLLRVVNSSYFGLRQKVDSITRAVLFIGTKNLRNMIVVQALKDTFGQSTKEDVFSRRMLWLHCAAVAICSQMISERIFTQAGEDAFLCGILHDIGMIVEDQVEHDLFLQACKVYEPGSKRITDYEKEIIGTDHTTIGYLLARDWKLPLEVQQGIKQHHLTLNGIAPSSISAMVQMAEYIATKLNYGSLPQMSVFLSPPIAAHMRDNIAEYKTLVKDFPEAMSKASDLYESNKE